MRNVIFTSRTHALAVLSMEAIQLRSRSVSERAALLRLRLGAEELVGGGSQHDPDPRRYVIRIHSLSSGGNAGLERWRHLDDQSFFEGVSLGWASCSFLHVGDNIATAQLAQYHLTCRGNCRYTAYTTYRGWTDPTETFRGGVPRTSSRPHAFAVRLRGKRAGVPHLRRVTDSSRTKSVKWSEPRGMPVPSGS